VFEAATGGHERPRATTGDHGTALASSAASRYGTGMAELGTQLQIAEDERGLVLDGEIDAHTAPRLEAAIERALEVSPTVRLHMAGVSFMDSSGLRVMIATTESSRARGGDLVLEAPSATVARLIEISGLVDHLTVVVPGG
jgi:anti-anti-sigma factor